MAWGGRKELPISVWACQGAGLHYNREFAASNKIDPQETIADAK